MPPPNEFWTSVAQLAGLPPLPPRISYASPTHACIDVPCEESPRSVEEACGPSYVTPAVRLPAAIATASSPDHAFPSPSEPFRN